MTSRTQKFSMRLILFLAVLCALSARADEPVAISENGRSRWVIVAPKTNSPGVGFAVAELQRYLNQLSGCKFPAGSRQKNKPAFAVGLRSEFSESDRALLQTAAQGFDGYSIAVCAATNKLPARIIVAGDNGCGVIYGVYDLLERFGCRWFYPTEDASDPEVVPKLKTLSLTAGSWSVASPMKHRICNGSGWFFEMHADEAVRQLDWAMKNRYNMMGWQGETTTSRHSLPWQYARLGELGVLAELEKRGMTMHGPAHSFDQFLKPDDYFAQHPNWFGVRDGKRVPQAFAGSQFCWSNPEARKQFIANAENFITNAPRIHIFCTLPFDGGIACACDDCKKIGASNLLMILLGELVERLKVSRPDVLVEATGGYGPATEPPTKPDIIHPELRIVWAHWGRGHSMGYDDPGYDRLDNLEKWRKAVNNRITICQYYTDNFAEPWVMSPFTVAIEGDRKYFLRNKIDSVYMLMWPRGYWWNHSLNGYLGGRCFYDVSLNPYDLLRDYAKNYFDKQAGALLANYFEQWAREPGLCYRIRGGSSDADRAKLAAQREKFIEPAMKLAAKDKRLAYRIGKVEKLHALAERLCEMHRQQKEIRRFRNTGEFEKAQSLLEKSRGYTDEVLAYFFQIADLNQGLMDRNEVPTFIKMNLKNWLEEESKAIALKKPD